MPVPNKKSVKRNANKSGKKPIKKQSKKTAKKSLKKDNKEEPTIVVLFFAHWCGHCQSMYPEWEKLQKEYENNNDVVLREIEHGNIQEDKSMLEHEYDVSPIQVQGFPTLVKFHPHKDVEHYEGGERTQSNMSSWILSDSKEKVPLDMMKFYYGGYKIPIIGKVRTYSKNKSKPKRSKSKNTMKSRPSLTSDKK